MIGRWIRTFDGGSFRATGQLLAARGVQQFGILVAGAFVARVEGPANYGLYAAAFSIGSLLVGGPTSGLPVLLLRRASEEDLDRRAVRRALNLQMTVACCASIAAALVGTAVFRSVSGAVASVAAGLGFACLSIALLGANVQSGRRHFGRAAASDLTAGLMFPTLTGVALGVGLGVSGALFAIAAAGLLASIPVWRDQSELGPTGESSPLRVTHALPFVALGILNAGYGRIDVVVLEMVRSSEEVGMYAAAYRMLGPLGLLGSAFGTVYFSNLSQADQNSEDWSRRRRGGAAVFLGVALVFLVALEASAPLVIRLVYGSNYASSVGPARVLLLSVIPWALYWPHANALNAAHLERMFSAILSLGLVVDVALVWIIARGFGAIGAAWAWVLSETVIMIGVAVASRGIVDRWQRVWERR